MSLLNYHFNIYVFNSIKRIGDAEIYDNILITIVQVTEV